MRFSVSVAVAIVTITFCAVALAPAWAIDSGAETGKAPDFNLPDLDGKMVNLSDDPGKLVVINFWATWCGYCVAEIPSMNSFAEKMKDEPLIFLSINIDDMSTEDVKRFATDKKIAFPVLLDPKGDTSQKYGVEGLPYNVVISSSGKIVGKSSGQRNWDDQNLISYFRGLMKKNKLD
jgi:thiol-disulfide isomerase/thioredoxin